MSEIHNIYLTTVLWWLDRMDSPQGRSGLYDERLVIAEALAYATNEEHDYKSSPRLLSLILHSLLRTELRLKNMQESQADFDTQLTAFFTQFTTYASSVAAYIAAVPAPVAANLAKEGAQVTAAMATLSTAMAALPVSVTPLPPPPTPAPTPVPTTP